MSGSLGKCQDILMSVFQLVAAAGLFTLVGGVAVVNVASTPRAAQIGTITAGCGVIILAVVAVKQLLA
jgi:hypothetical protein